MLPYHGGAILARQANNKSPQRNSRSGKLFLVRTKARRMPRPSEKGRWEGLEGRARRPAGRGGGQRAPDAATTQSCISPNVAYRPDNDPVHDRQAALAWPSRSEIQSMSTSSMPR